MATNPFKSHTGEGLKIDSLNSSHISANEKFLVSAGAQVLIVTADNPVFADLLDGNVEATNTDINKINLTFALEYTGTYTGTDTNDLLRYQRKNPETGATVDHYPLISISNSEGKLKVGSVVLNPKSETNKDPYVFDIELDVVNDAIKVTVSGGDLTEEVTIYERADAKVSWVFQMAISRGAFKDVGVVIEMDDLTLSYTAATATVVAGN